jgi:Tfp pilus assembly protein PilO
MNGEGLLKSFRSIDPGTIRAFKAEAVGLAALVVFSALFFRFVYSRNAGEIASAAGRVNAARAEMEGIRAEIQASENLSKVVAQASENLLRLDERLKGVKERLPSERQVSSILDELTDGAMKRDVLVVSVKPLQHEAQGELLRMPFQVTLEARFISIGGYIERLENLPRIIMVDNFMMEPRDDGAGALTAQMYISAYTMTSGR